MSTSQEALLPSTLHYLSSTFKEELLPSKQLLTKALLPFIEHHTSIQEELLSLHFYRSRRRFFPSRSDTASIKEELYPSTLSLEKALLPFTERHSSIRGGALSLPLQRSDYPDVTLQVWPEPPFDGQASCAPREGQQPVNPVSRVPREDQLAESSNSRLPCEDQQTWNPASPLQPSERPASCIPREDQPPTVIEIPCGSPHPAEGRPHTPDSPQCPETPGKWFRPDLHTRSPVRARSPSPPSPHRPRKHSPPSLGWWMDHRMRK